MDVVGEVVDNHDDFGGVFCGGLQGLRDMFERAGLPVPASWSPLTDERDVPAGAAFDRSAPGSDMITVDGTPMMSFFWHGADVSAGVGVRGWTSIAFAFPRRAYRGIELVTI
ncbi:hypothetical protein [Streptomyces sp. CA-111067]|uniref:hypothetical protein n=1 Tax=Streptomyces sp. CA-111067 TaxID=3240046 RepID=UPI003D971B42